MRMRIVENMFVIGFYATIPLAIIYALTEHPLVGYMLFFSGLLIITSVIIALIGGLKKYHGRWV